jgi:hypothetical protein
MQPTEVVRLNVGAEFRWYVGTDKKPNYWLPFVNTFARDKGQTPEEVSTLFLAEQMEWCRSNNMKFLFQPLTEAMMWQDGERFVALVIPSDSDAVYFKLRWG